MPFPPLVCYATEAEYRNHFETHYCRSVITTSDGFRIYFSKDSFNHAFFECSQRDGRKDQFSSVRAERINWISATLTNPLADRFQGWSTMAQRYEPDRRVEVVYENFVVVIQLKRDKNGVAKGNFVTCYQADNSIGKIRQSPRWTLGEFLHMTGRKNGR